MSNSFLSALSAVVRKDVKHDPHSGKFMGGEGGSTLAGGRKKTIHAETGLSPDVKSHAALRASSQAVGTQNAFSWSTDPKQRAAIASDHETAATALQSLHDSLPAAHPDRKVLARYAAKHTKQAASFRDLIKKDLGVAGVVAVLELQKRGNPNHGQDGKFSSGGGAGHGGATASGPASDAAHTASAAATHASKVAWARKSGAQGTHDGAATSKAAYDTAIAAHRTAHEQHVKAISSHPDNEAAQLHHLKAANMHAQEADALHSALIGRHYVPAAPIPAGADAAHAKLANTARIHSNQAHEAGFDPLGIQQPKQAALHTQAAASHKAAADAAMAAGHGGLAGYHMNHAANHVTWAAKHAPK